MKSMINIISSLRSSKKFTYIALAFSSLFMASCDDEDGFYNEKYANTGELVTIDIQPTYAVGDFLYVDADFGRYQSEEGFPQLLDIYETTSGAPGFVFTYLMEKESSPGIWTPVSTTLQQLQVNSGTAQAGNFVLGTALYNASDETYEYNVGYPLTSAGNYRLSFGVNSDSANKIELRSKTQGNKLFLNLISSTTQLTGGGFYTFTVN
ncbi:hypothetical protein [Flavobacterium sp.]|uniref:hypothetical protein n=1 Tax=Flavobacterium sp. TaxID=239 RepID=UPI001203467E|nr:hypothetical protein [Flavobacterium sp.]RZJ72783.1 MAG: hypothetical protein EOO49_03860 [Flavobacterium sp.]